MPKAVWNGTVLADSDHTEVVEGNHYFPADSVSTDHLRPSERTSVCPWKGTASYYDVVVGEDRRAAGAWYYPDPSDAAANIRDHIAFYGFVDVVD
ncbi:MAG: DUF427 domain-containing protein [Acidimicrobiia bacterium]|nr:DUF427 domain-containing protein [Acidimicrobiia bacterium]